MRKKRNKDWEFLMHLVFSQVFPVWKRFNGKVTPLGLRRLDHNADFPLGVAGAAVKRLNRDLDLQKECERVFTRKGTS